MAKAEGYTDIFNGEDSSGTEVSHVKTISEGVENIEKTIGETNSSGTAENGARKLKMLTEMNEKLAHQDIKDAALTSSSEGLLVQSEVNDGQQIDTNISRSVSGPLITGNVEILNGKHCVTRSKKILLILDVNGLLADIIHPPPLDCKSDINISRRASKICYTISIWLLSISNLLVLFLAITYILSIIA